MKKKVLTFVLAMCFILPCAFMLVACGNQFIEERTYNLLGMTVIKDNTPYIYSPFDDGEYYTSFCGDMDIEKCTLEVGKKSSTLIFDDTQETGIKAVYIFDVYTDDDTYPAYSFKSYSITINGEEATNLSETEISNLPSNVGELYVEVKQFSTVCGMGDTSIQLITQNKSLACHIVVKDSTNGSLLFMSMLYGY